MKAEHVGIWSPVVWGPVLALGQIRFMVLSPSGEKIMVEARGMGGQVTRMALRSRTAGHRVYVEGEWLEDQQVPTLLADRMEECL